MGQRPDATEFMTSMPFEKPKTARTATASGTRPSSRFWVCVVLLGLAAVGVQVLPGMLNVYLRKEPVPLKSPLALLDLRKLEPRYTRHPDTDRIPPMSDEMVESLGTEEYLVVYLRDTTVPVTASTSVAHLFVTYYTGKPDMVPHVPDECFRAGGYNKLRAYTAPVNAVGVGAPDDEIAVRVVDFEASPGRSLSGSSARLSVLYFFHANGTYVTTRNGVRANALNPFQRYAYYAKIEMSFFAGNGRGGNASAEESLAAAGPLLEALLPVLFEDHFDLDKFAEADGHSAEQSKERG